LNRLLYIQRPNYNGWERTLSCWYRDISVLVLTTSIILIVLNLLAAVVLTIRDSSDPVTRKYGTTLNHVYPGLTSGEIDNLLKETWSLRTLAHEPFTMFTERPFHGKYVNVDGNGFRVSDTQGPWPLNKQAHYNVFMFGGSTTFGYGVADKETIGSYLQEFLGTAANGRTVRIYNFGRAFFFSTQERVLLETLLQAGLVPDAAIFLDGLNDFYYVEGLPEYTDQFQQLFNQGNDPSLLRDLGALPAIRLGHRVMNKGISVLGLQPKDDDARKDPLRLRKVIIRYIENKRLTEAVAAAYRIKAFFIWQPIPNYRYDLTLHLFPDHLPGDNEGSSLGYRQMAEYVNSHSMGDNFVWCADIQQAARTPLYVDPTHYSGKMSSMVARCIADGIKGSLAPQL
jgi:hypothetical protein